MYGGDALQGPLFRIVKQCPPTLDDFRSYEALGKRYDRRDFFKATGISMHTSGERSLEIARRYRTGGAVATVVLEGVPVAWAATGGRGHVTVWAPAELLLAHVVQCESHD